MSASSTLVNPSESLESVLRRAPSCSLMTPDAGKRVNMRPLKRVKFSGGDAATKTEAVEEPEEREENVEEDLRELLEPRRLDMEQPVALANPSLEDEEDENPVTQPYPGEDNEEGELPPSSSPSDSTRHEELTE